MTFDDLTPDQRFEIQDFYARSYLAQMRRLDWSRELRRRERERREDAEREAKWCALVWALADSLEDQLSMRRRSGSVRLVERNRSRG